MFSWFKSSNNVNNTKSQELVETLDDNNWHIENEYSIIKINVGGTIFSTSRHTLLKFKDSYFEYMLSTHQQEGCYFIDRDASMFHLILRYMRGQNIYVFNQLSELQRMQLQEEAKYYGLVSLFTTLPLK